MKKSIWRIVLSVLFLTVFSQCQQHAEKPVGTVKNQPGDPFAKTIAPSQFFRIRADRDTVVEGEKGTVLVLPKGCFKKADGQSAIGEITVELAEAVTLDQMLLSNLTTTADGKPLETDGMIYFNATANDEQLTVSTEKPMRIEIPTDKRKPGMMAYRGIRDKNGNMNWVEPKPLENSLVAVDINLLDFLPAGFYTAVEEGMPFRNHKTATKTLADSLYYSLAISDRRDRLDGFSATNYNEPYYNKNAEIIDGKYPKESYEVTEPTYNTGDDVLSKEKCGIDPASIKVIQAKKYQNTLLATREFEARMQLIHRACDNKILEMYIKNLDKNLYEIDSMAASMASNDELRQEFKRFSQQRLTKVKGADKYAQLLKVYYERQVAKVRKELEDEKEKYLKKLDKENRKFEKVADKYRNLLWEREKYRMETYGFEWTETGWINIDNGTLPKPWDSYPLEVTVENGGDFERVHVYVVYTSIKSLYRLNAIDNAKHYAGNSEDNEMLMPKQETALAIAIGYKGEEPHVATREFRTGVDSRLTMKLSVSSSEELKEMISPYEKYRAENRISKDLAFMRKMFEEEQRQAALLKESLFVQRLRTVAFSCCNISDGMTLFNNNCAACHSTGNEVVVGPGLAGATSRRPMSWLFRWVRNSAAMIASGEAYSNRIFNEYSKLQMQSFPDLTDDDIRAIFSYIDEKNSRK